MIGYTHFIIIASMQMYDSSSQSFHTTHASSSQFKCPKGRKAVVVCVNDKCDHHAFCCKEANCCQKIFRPKCKLMKAEDFEKLYETSRGRMNSIYNETMKFFEDIHQMIDNEIKNFKEWSEKSAQIVRIFENTEELDNKTGQDIAKILDDLNQYSQEYYEDVLAYEKLWDKNMRELLAEVRVILCERNRKRMGNQPKTVNKIVNEQINKVFSLTTRIVWKENQMQALFDILNYLKGKNSVNLLYHAGSHEFSAVKFHQLCDGIPNTLVIIRNDRQKIYGGFTPLPWGKAKFQKFVCDDSLKTFVFSLTHKKKFLLREQQKYYAIEWNNLFGPIFGRCNMIQIWDKAHKQSSYWEHIPFSFKPMHGEWTNEMYEQIMGVHKYQQFKLLDWEVFQVVFD